MQVDFSLSSYSALQNLCSREREYIGSDGIGGTLHYYQPTANTNVLCMCITGLISKQLPSSGNDRQFLFLRCDCYVTNHSTTF